MYSKFNEHVFKDKVASALKTVERILEVHRNPRLAQNVEHEYGNKYGLADLLTNAEIIAQMNCLERMGVTASVLQGIDKSKPTTLRFQASDSCTFLKEQNVEVPMETPSVETTEDTETTGSFFGSTKKSTISRVVTHIQEYHWKVDVQWEVSIYSGTNVDEKTVVQSRSSSMIIAIQSNKHQPLPDHRDHNPLDVSLTWLMKQIDADSLTAQFKIDTQHPDTKTPRRNKQVDDTLAFLSNLQHWTRGVRSHFADCVQRGIIDKHNPAGPQQTAHRSISTGNISIVAGNIFLPIQPLMEEPSGDKDDATQETEKADPKSILSLAPAGAEEKSESSPLLSVNDMHKLLNEQIRSLQEKTDALQKAFPAKQLVKLMSVAEATLVLLCEHSDNLSDSYAQSMKYIERMLENQLVSAIGKRIESSDLDQFVKFHNAKLLNPPPRPFCHSVRRPNHYPDGILSIESENGDGKMEPIDTLMREVESASPLKVPLNAATTLELTGKTFLHGWIQHRFHNNIKSYKLIARARQFSSFMLVVGTMIGSDRLEPKDAIILQNKDELLIPLLLNELPTPTEFKDAIRSLSPEQQRFAKAFRSMQLESSVFGVCVIQIKPQLEELLGLPPNALTKEMKLTQELLELFVEYQVPSDLLSYDGDDDKMNVKEKVSIVKGHVQAVMDVIGAAKTKQLEESVMRADMATESAVANHPEAFELMAFSSAAGPVAESRAASYRGGAPQPPEINSGRRSRRLLQKSHAVAAPQQMMMSAAAPVARSGVIKSAHSHRPNKSHPRSAAKAAPQQTMMAQFDMAEAEASAMSFSTQAIESATTTRDQPSPKTPETPDSVGYTGSNEGIVDFTMMPKMLDASIEQHDRDSALRSTIIKTSNTWTRSRQENLLTKMRSTTLHSLDIKAEKEKAFDLLDALSRSGSLPISCSELHVMICVTHCFEKDVMRTVIQDNINPIEKLEMSTLLIASTIHGVPANMLIRDANETHRLTASFPALLGTSDETTEDRVEPVNT